MKRKKCQRHIVEIFHYRCYYLKNLHFEVGKLKNSMGDYSKKSVSDDEEDLEALRLAALQSLKKKNAQNNGNILAPVSLPKVDEKPNRYHNRPPKGIHNKRGRFFGSHLGRIGKNGQFSNNRVRITNLISITPIDSEEKKEIKENSQHTPRLTLPQDRYCGGDIKSEKMEEVSSKFDRYNDSDESEEESEDIRSDTSETENEGKLERSDSLEALMQELDDEIQGKTKNKDEKVVKPKTKAKKARKSSVSESTATSSTDVDEKAKDNSDIIRESSDLIEESAREIPENKPGQNISIETENLNLKIPEEKKTEIEDNRISSSPEKKPPLRDPMNKRGNIDKINPRNRAIRNEPFARSNNSQNVPFDPLHSEFQRFNPIPPFNNTFPVFNPVNLGIPIQPPVPATFIKFDRPLSPLSLNTDALTTATLAPLSPRSAAFVMENRAIIEKRKRSPRSYSRSPSPRYRRSKSPKRSLTPRRSLSPRRKSRSPRRRSLSPKRVSPPRRVLPKKDDVSKLKPSIHDRLGTKTNVKKEVNSSDKVESSPQNEEPPLDPILEARKRKFESKEIKMKEGVIRLRPKEEAVSSTTPSDDIKEFEDDVDTEELDEDALLEGDDLLDLETKVDDIFSDEESASDNEGRFKAKLQSAKKVPILPFTKLVNGVKREVTVGDRREDTDSGDKRYSQKNVKRSKSSPIKDRRKLEPTQKKSPADSKDYAKLPDPRPADSAVVLREKNNTKISKLKVGVAPGIRNKANKVKRIRSPIERKFDRKIEIKIKNPSKYERSEEKPNLGKDEDKGEIKTVRKVALAKKDEESDNEPEPEILVENDSEDEYLCEAPPNMSEGDLRAQLSKKRAERLNKHSVDDGIPKRLLQNALQSAVFKKAKKNIEQDINSDGKLPIHLRLGIANNSDIFATEGKLQKKKSRKRKNRGSLEQV